MYEPYTPSSTPTQKQQLKKAFYDAVELQHAQVFAAAGNSQKYLYPLCLLFF